MAKRRKTIRKNNRKTWKTALTDLLIGFVILLVIIAAVVSISEAYGGILPSWEDIYTAFGVGQSPKIPQEAKDAATKVHFIDVGQADAVLLEQDGAFALIDAGDGAAQEELIAYLRAAGVERLSLMVMTHPHSDHIGGMRAVLENFVVERILLPDFSKAPLPTTYTLENVLTAIAEKGIPAETAASGNTYAIGEGILTILHAGIETQDSYNNISVITLFEAPGLRYLASGDAEALQEQDLVAWGGNLQANLYKAGHHGSNTSSSAAFLQEIAPQVVVVSCGLDNSYGHPHAEPLARFAQIGATVYRTDWNGTVIAYVDQNGTLRIAVSKEK